MAPKILFDDNSIVVIDKPAGFIVHNGDESVSGWLEKHDPKIANHSWPDPERAGIVHRLDQETSGILVLAKSPDVLEKLQEQFQAHTINKIYDALVFGHPDPEQGSIDVPIGRHPGRKTPMSVVPVEEVARGKVREAKTDYKVVEEFKDASLVEATIHTGRTHQIRLHMKYIGHPVLGDRVYGIKPSQRLSKTLGISRQMLHAKSLSFIHPQTQVSMTFESPWPYDFEQALSVLRNNR